MFVYRLRIDKLSSFDARFFHALFIYQVLSQKNDVIDLSYVVIYTLEWALLLLNTHIHTLRLRTFLSSCLIWLRTHFCLCWTCPNIITLLTLPRLIPCCSYEWIWYNNRLLKWHRWIIYDNCYNTTFQNSFT